MTNLWKKAYNFLNKEGMSDEEIEEFVKEYQKRKNKKKNNADTILARLKSNRTNDSSFNEETRYSLLIKTGATFNGKDFW